MIVLMEIRMLIIHLWMIHLLLRGDVVVGVRRWILWIVIASTTIIHRWIRVRLVYWSRWFIKAIVIGFIIVVSIIVHSIWLVLVIVPVVGLHM